MAKDNRPKRSRVYKRIELVGLSPKSFEDAIENAVEKANQTIKGLSWFEVKELRGSLKNGQINEYQTVVAISFEVR